MDRAALEVALAALGDPSYLKRQHFILGSYTIGYGGLRVIEMYRGEHGMDALVHGALEHAWAAVSNEAEAVFERITGKKAPKRAVKGEK